MTRVRLAVAVSAGAAAVAVAVVLATGALEQTSSHSPSCLPATLSHSARLRGLPVYVSPAPQTGTANPRTQISFLGMPARAIRQVSVTGQHSGPHPGRLRAYSQGDGASFVPDRPFQAGERVSVNAEIGAAGRRVAFGFRVDTPYPTASIPPFPNPKPPPSDYQSFATAPGMQAPVLAVTLQDRDPQAGDIFTTNGPGPGRYGPLIYTPQGRLVWFDQLADGESAENLSVQDYEGARDLTFWQGKVLNLGFGEGEDVVLDSGYRTVARVGGGNGLRADLHDFQIAPHGVAYATAYNPIRCDLRRAGGTGDGAIVDTAVQEIDMRTGLVRWEWHSLDHVGVDESQTGAQGTSTPWDWFHLNSVDVLASGDLFLSARSTWAGYLVRHGGGEVLWRLGGSKSSFKLGAGVKTAWQHDGRILANGEITIFDNGSNPPVHSRSRALKIALNLATRKARLRAAYTHPAGLLSVSQGNVQTLSGGDVVVGYGAVPQVSEFAPNGSLLFDAHLPLEMDSYRAFRFPWHARPASDPAVLASANNTGEETIVRASWNGATGVAAWRVLAGAGPGSLAARATIPASGFESSTILAKKWAYVSVQALDAAGRVLGASQPARVVGYGAMFSGQGK
jgi:hypothetical protein